MTEVGKHEFTGRRLLLVDDEQEYVLILAKRLVKRGYQVTKTFSGSEYKFFVAPQYEQFENFQENGT